MQTSRRGQQFIKDGEGLRLVAYLCPAGVWTIGWGHTSDEKYPVKKGMKITKAQAEILFKHDVEEAEAAIRRHVKVQLNGNQYGALVSFIFNVGVEAFRKSSLLRMINKGAGAISITKAFSLWVKGGTPKRTIKGLVKRRADEAALYHTPDSLGDNPIKLPNTGKPTAQIEEGRNAKHDVSPSGVGTGKVGSGVASIGAGGAVEQIKDATDQLTYVADYSSVIQAVVVALVSLGAIIMLYGLYQRWKDQ